jgi:hypothetical protein
MRPALRGYLSTEPDFGGVRDVLLVAGSLLVAVALIAGTFILLTGSAPPQPVILSEDVTFPDYSSGHPGMNASNAVAFHVNITTSQPWVQGRDQHPGILIVAEPGPGVADVNVNTFFLDLARTGVRGALTGDFDLVRETTPNRWTPESGAIQIWPDNDVVGNDLYLTFQLSLNVDYVNGSAYGYGGWNPSPRLPVAIAFDPVPWALGAYSLGAVAGLGLIAADWTRGPARRIRERRPRA